MEVVVEGEESLLRRLQVWVQVRWRKEAEMTERERHRDEMGRQPNNTGKWGEQQREVGNKGTGKVNE